MPKLYLVRHAMPELDAALSPRDWQLTADGRAAARALRRRLPTQAACLSSTERKAHETLYEALQQPITTNAGFDEISRPSEPIGADVRSPRRAWIADQPDDRHSHWETTTHAAQRFEQALSRAPEGDLIIATHGMVLTAWLVHQGAVRPGEPAAAFWEALDFPDLVILDRPTARFHDTEQDPPN